MKALLVGECRAGILLESTYELLGFSAQAGCDSDLFLVGSDDSLPESGGTVYLADVEACGEYNPVQHKQLILEAVEKLAADRVVFSHSSYGWDLAPRVALALGAAPGFGGC